VLNIIEMFNQFIIIVIICLFVVLGMLLWSPHPVDRSYDKTKTVINIEKGYGQLKNNGYDLCMMPIHDRELNHLVVLAECNTDRHQTWDYVNNQLKNIENEKCLSQDIGVIDNKTIMANCMIPISYMPTPANALDYETVYPHAHQTVNPDIRLNDYQNWELKPHKLNPNSFQIVNKSDNTCLDVTNTAYGLTVIQAACDDSSTQFWSFDRVNWDPNRIPLK
jgi:hypothetical protein